MEGQALRLSLSVLVEWSSFNMSNREMCHYQIQGRCKGPVNDVKENRGRTASAGLVQTSFN